MRRVIVWAVVIFVVLGGVLAGNRRAAQDDGSQVLMLLSKYDTASETYSFLVFNPVTDESRSLPLVTLLEYLRESIIKTDVLTDIYQWSFGGGITFNPPRSGSIGNIIARHYIGTDVPIFAQPSKDWLWIVALTSGNDGTFHIYSINLMTGKTTDLFATNGLYFNNADFHVAISSDWVFVNAAHKERENALYRLRLDGNNPEEIVPFANYDMIPLQWLEGTDYLLFSESWMSEGRPITLLNAGLVDEQGLGGTQTAFHSTEAIQPQFELWLPEENILIYSTWDYDSDDESVIGYSIAEAEIEWGILQWSVISLTDDHQWMVLKNADNNLLGRMRTDGSQFEVVAELPESIKQAEGSANGRWAAGLSSSAIYRIDMSTGVVTKLAAVEEGFWVQLNYSSVSPDGKWISYWRPHPTERKSELVLLNAEGEYIKPLELEENTFLGWVTLDDLP